MVVLGIDNIVFISVIVGKLPPEQAKRARQIGLLLALVFRIILLFSLFWLTHLRRRLHPRRALSWRDMVLIAGNCLHLRPLPRSTMRRGGGVKESTTASACLTGGLRHRHGVLRDSVPPSAWPTTPA
jgi:predicted tellurium resistance membrane protein TerC